MLTEPDDAGALRGRARDFLAGHDPATLPREEFLRARFDAGLAWVHYPPGLGGLGLPRSLQSVVDAEFAAAGAPDNEPVRNTIGLGMAAPTILSFGTDEQKARWLRPLWTGEEIWCQLFSEPGSWPSRKSAARWRSSFTPSAPCASSAPPRPPGPAGPAEPSPVSTAGRPLRRSPGRTRTRLPRCTGTR